MSLVDTIFSYHQRGTARPLPSDSPQRYIGNPSFTIGKERKVGMHPGQESSAALARVKMGEPGCLRRNTEEQEP